MKCIVFLVTLAVVVMVADASRYWSDRQQQVEDSEQREVDELLARLAGTLEGMARKHVSSNGDDLLTTRSKNFFNSIDVNKTGALTQSDFNKGVDVFAQVESLTPTQKGFLKQLLTLIWEEFYQPISSSMEAFVAAIKAMQAPDGKFEYWSCGVFTGYFACIDANDDGYITFSSEWNPVYMALFNNTDYSLKSFEAMSSNKQTSGNVTLCPFLAYAKSYFTSNDPNDASKYFWGKYVSKD